MGVRNSKSSLSTTESSHSCDNIATTATNNISSNNANCYKAEEQTLPIGSVAVLVSADSSQLVESSSVSNAQLSNCSSNSLTSDHSNCAKQIIIKIQYTKMENDQNDGTNEESQEQRPRSEREWGQVEHTLAVVESCNGEALDSNAQFLNVNLTAREVAGASGAAGSSTGYNRSSSSAAYNRHWSHNTVDSVEYCEVLEENAAEPQSSTGAIPKKKERKSGQTRSNSKQGAIRNAINRWLEPSSSKSNKNKERKSGKHSKNNEQQVARHPTAQAQFSRHSMPIRQTPNNSHSNRPISIAGLSPRFNDEGPCSNNGNAPAAHTNGNHFLWAHMNASPRVVVIQPNISVMSLSSDHIVRWMTADMSGVRVGVADTSASQVVGGTVASAARGPIVHSQVDFVHSLVPDLQKIFNTSYYWGKMDRYEAERLLEGKPEGTFLLRDSAQDEFLFSVTFRKYGRSLHARIEQSERRFSFDSLDPGVFTAPTVTGLLDHYKDPSCVMFYEPMLTIPLHRRTTFSLQDLSRATIVSCTSYDGINELELPARLLSYLKEYHYKEKLRVKQL